MDLLQKLSEEIKKVEELRAQVGESVEPWIKKEVSGAGSLMEEEVLTTSMVLWYEDTKILKPPQVCIFSGNEPVPKEEGNANQWEFQVWGALAMHTENSVHAAIVKIFWKKSSADSVEDTLVISCNKNFISSIKKNGRRFESLSASWKPSTDIFMINHQNSSVKGN